MQLNSVRSPNDTPHQSDERSAIFPRFKFGDDTPRFPQPENTADLVQASFLYDQWSQVVGPLNTIASNTQQSTVMNATAIQSFPMSNTPVSLPPPHDSESQEPAVTASDCSTIVNDLIASTRPLSDSSWDASTAELSTFSLALDWFDDPYNWLNSSDTHDYYTTGHSMGTADTTKITTNQSIGAPSGAVPNSGRSMSISSLIASTGVTSDSESSRCAGMGRPARMPVHVNTTGYETPSPGVASTEIPPTPSESQHQRNTTRTFKVRMLRQMPYQKGPMRRTMYCSVSYGPNGFPLVNAIPMYFGGPEMCDGHEIAFPNMRIGQKKSIRYQFHNYPPYTRQANVGMKNGQPTKARLASVCAREMRLFCERCEEQGRPFCYRPVEDLVLLRIDVASDGSLQPWIGAYNTSSHCGQ